MLSSGNLSITQNAINILEQRARAGDSAAQPVERDVDVRRRAPARRRAARGEDARRPLPGAEQHRLAAPTSSSAARSAASRRGCSTSTAKATSSRRRRTPAISRSARASTASRCIDRVIKRGDVAARRDQVHDGLVRLDDALEHLGRAADRPRRLRDRRAARSSCSGGSRRPTRTSRWSTRQWGEGLRRVFAQLPDPGLDVRRRTRDGHPRRAAAPHHAIASTGTSPCRRTRSACGRRRIAARRSSAIRCSVAPDTALPQLAAGPVRQLGRAARVSRAAPTSSRSSSTSSPT